jgi:trk system potassium uptake protein TrkH
MDEISLGASTLVGELKDGTIREYEIHPEDFGLQMASNRSLRVGGAAESKEVIFSVLAFMLVYGATVIGLSMVLLLTDLDPVTAFSAVLASVNCAGPGLGAVGPASNFAVLTDFQVWVCTLAMLLGRLEILSFMAVLTPAFWRR